MIRKATISDCKEMQGLINFWAKKGRVLERSLNYLYENIRDFWVYTEKKKIVACCSLHVVGWQELAEIKSLTVAEKFQGKGIGIKLVKKCLEEAKSLGVKKIFALTFSPDFFKRLGFRKVDKKNLPHKIWSDCINCAEFPDCKEAALLLKIT